MRKIKHMPAERAYPKGIPKTSVPSGQSYWKALTGVQLSLYDIQTIRTIRIGGGKQ